MPQSSHSLSTDSLFSLVLPHSCCSSNDIIVLSVFLFHVFATCVGFFYRTFCSRIPLALIPATMVPKQTEKTISNMTMETISVRDMCRAYMCVSVFSICLRAIELTRFLPQPKRPISKLEQRDSLCNVCVWLSAERYKHNSISIFIRRTHVTCRDLLCHIAKCIRF